MVDLPEVIGLPPSTWVSDIIIENSMPIIRITPSEPEFKLGLSLFTLKPAMTEYKEILESLGYNLTTTSLKIAYLADNFPTDTFSNEYGESFLQKFSDTASSGASQLAQIAGVESADEAAGKVGNFLSEQGGILGTLGKGITGGVDSFKKFIDSNSGSGGMGGNIAKTLNSVLAGSRVDFPQAWRGSGFTPSYSMTVRLYNPRPASDKSVDKYITGPIAALLLCCLPRSKDGNTYNWPFLHSIQSPGIYGLSPAFVSNVAIIKGGDQQSISYNQRMGIVDVRVDFGSLYNSILIDTQKKISKTDRPTLRGYLEEFKSQKRIEYPDRENGPSGVSENRTSQQTETVKFKSETNIANENELFDDEPSQRIAGDHETTTNFLLQNSVYGSVNQIRGLS